MDVYCESVECRSDTARQLRLKLGVTRAMREMREPGLSRANLLRGTYSLRHAQMRRVRLAEQSVEDEDIDPAKGARRIFRQLLGVGDVSKIADAVAINGDRAVWNGHWRDIHVSDPKGLARKNRVGARFGFARAGQRLDGVVEDVRETLRQSRHRVGR